MGHIEWAIGELDIEGFLKDSFLCNHQQENHFVTLTGIASRATFYLSCKIALHLFNKHLSVIYI